MPIYRFYQNKNGKQYGLDERQHKVMDACWELTNEGRSSRESTNSDINKLANLKLSADDVGLIMSGLRAIGMIDYHHVVTGRHASGSGRYKLSVVGFLMINDVPRKPDLSFDVVDTYDNTYLDQIESQTGQSNLIPYTNQAGTKYLLSIEQHKIIYACSKIDSATNGDIKSLAKMDEPASEIGLIINDLKSKGLIDYTLKGKRYNNLTVTGVKEAVGELVEVSKPTTVVNGLNAKQAEFMALVEETLANGKRGNVINLVGEGGVGKAAPLDEPVLTPNGFVTMADIQVGDFVISEQGKPIKVLQVFNHKDLNMYQVTFQDGRTTRCCEDHLWEVQTTKLRQNGRSRVMPLKDLIKGVERERTEKLGYYYSIPVCKPIEYQEKELLIPPYEMGYLLGNGYSGATCLQITIGNIDADEIFSYFNLPLLRKYRTDSVTHGYIKFETRLLYESMGLKRVLAQGKHIPDIYFFGSIDQRIQLLKGLMDSDGYCGKNKARYSSKSLQLAKDVQQLVWSLGGRAVISIADRTRDNKGMEYSVQIRTPFNPFRLKRKAERYVLNKRDLNNCNGIAKIEPIGIMDGKCITVNSERGLYITKDFIVTHNTYVIHRLKEKHGEDMIITATTGIAAQNIGGCTIHSYLGLKPEFNHHAESIDDDTELKGFELGERKPRIAVIDESSMMGYDLFKEVMTMDFQLLILSGDNQQLPPVKDRAVDFTKYPTIELTEQMRTKSNAYKLIKAYREAKEAGMAETINFDDYIDGESVQSIKITELVSHFKNNKSIDKRVISFKNETAEAVIEAIKPKTKVYQLLSALTVWSPEAGQEILRVNGDTIEIEKVFKSWVEAVTAYRFKHGEDCKHRTKWKNDTKLEFTYASIKGIDTHFVRLLFGQRAEYIEVLKSQFKKVMVEKKKLKDKHGDNWELCKSPEYKKEVGEYMSIKAGVVRARHVCSMTAHKSQGQTIKTCYVIMNEMESNPALMYVALSRASETIVLVW